MSVSMNPCSGISRRSFLKTTAAVGAASLMVGSTPLSALAESAPQGVEGAAAAEGEQVFRGVCRPNCFGFCHLNVHVHDGKVMKTTRGAYNESCYNRICQRGLSHVQRIYDPNRLHYPMRRIEGSERGTNEFERISWDEALDEIAEKIKSTQNQYGEGSFAFFSQSGNQAVGLMQSYSRLAGVLNASNILPCLDMASNYGMAQVAGLYTSPLMGMMNWNGNEPTDAKNAKTIVVWGANITDAQVQNWHLIKEAIDSGTKLVVIDPEYTMIASHADKWIPVRPGSDTMLKLALMRIVLEKDAQDNDYLTQYTVAPYLVRSDTGKFLRRSDTGVAPTPTGRTNPTTQEEIMLDPPMVLQSGDIVPDIEANSPELEGVFNFGGIQCETAFSLLKKRVFERTVEEASEITEVPVDDIYELADICIDIPVFHYEGYGPQAYNNGAQTTIAGLTLCALLGNLGKPGASYGAFWGIGILPMVGGFAAPTGPSTGGNIQSVDFQNYIEEGKLGDFDTPIKMLWMYTANPINTHTDTHVWTDKILPTIDYVVVADSAMTDTAMYADMILPVAQWFELEDIAISGQTVSYNYNEKAIDPPFECKPDSEIVVELASRLGVGQYFDMTNQEIIQKALTGPMATMLHLGYEEIKEAKQVRFLPGNAETAPFIAYEGGSFTTPTGKFEFYRETPTPRALTTKQITAEDIEREHLPNFVPPLEAWPENPLYEKYPFVLLSERPRYRVHSQWFSTPLLREIDPEPIVKINPKDAQAHGIEDQSYVEAFNDRGTAVAKAVYSEGIRPGTLVYPKGWQISQHKGGGWSNLSSTEYDVFAVNNNFMDVLCGIRPWDGEER